MKILLFIATLTIGSMALACGGTDLASQLSYKGNKQTLALFSSITSICKLETKQGTGVSGLSEVTVSWVDDGSRCPSTEQHVELKVLGTSVLVDDVVEVSKGQYVLTPKINGLFASITCTKAN